VRIHFQQPLLQGYGTALNSRRIRVATNGRVSARETFRGQVLTLTAGVLNQYWSVVSALNETKMRQRALEVTQKFYDDTKFEISLGALPRIELPRFEAEVASRNRDLILADGQLRQQEEALKQLLVRREDATIEAARVVPMDAIEIPDRDDLPSLGELVKAAMANRPDVVTAKIADENAAINAMGTANGLLPILIAYADTYNRGAAGAPSAASGVATASNFVGGYGTALGQIFRRDFPNEYAGVQLSGFPIHNRQSQADYGIEQIQLQASQISSQRDNNAIAVNVSNQLIALQQARSRHSTAVNTRKLQEQILEDDQRKFSYGTATFNNLIIDERALVAAQISEVTAQASYARARVALDQVVGRTLEANHVSLEDAINGQVSRPSAIPEAVGAQQKAEKN
jgi:outer membrane protein TolC